MFLHLAQIYANSFNLISFTYMKMTAEHGSKCRFLSLIFNVSNIIHHFTFVFFLSFFFSISLPAVRISLLFQTYMLQLIFYLR